MMDQAKDLINRLRDLVNTLKTSIPSNHADRQLVVINDAIRQLERGGIPVPDDLRSTKIRLISEQKDAEDIKTVISLLKTELGSIMEELDNKERKKRTSRSPSIRESEKFQEIMPLKNNPPSSGSTSGELESYGFIFNDETFHKKSSLDVLASVFLKFQEQDQSFFEKFSSPEIEHGTSRRYLGRSPGELFPERPDFWDNRKYWREISPGWYIDVHESKKSIQNIIRLACNVAGIRLGKDLVINLG